MTNDRFAAIITPATAGVAHPVERHLAKVEVASSSLVTRSTKKTTFVRWTNVVFFEQACLAAREAHFVLEAMLRIVKRLRTWVARFTSRCAKHNTSQRHHRCFACRTVAGFTKCCRFLRKKCLHFLREAFIIILHILPLCRYDGIGRRSGLKIRFVIAGS